MDTGGSGEVDLPLLLKCHKSQSRVLHEHNLQFARTNDALGRAYACLGVSFVCHSVYILL